MRNIQDALYKGRKVTLIENLIYDELGQAVLRLHNEKFKGVKGIEDLTEYEPDQPLSFSNTPRSLSYNQILRELSVPAHVLSLKEMVRYLVFTLERATTYADSDSVAIFPREGPNEDLRQQALSIAGIQNPEQPYLISGLGVDKADNAPFKFTETDHVLATPAPYLTHNCRVKYDPNTDSLVEIDDQKGINIWTPKNQSGLRSAYRNRSDGLDFEGVGLLYSVDDGRVQILCEPQAHAKNLEAKAV